YIDTLLVCTATALIILFTGKYNIHHPNGGFIEENLPGIEPGSKFTIQAIAVHFPQIADKFVALAIFFVCFYHYYCLLLYRRIQYQILIQKSSENSSLGNTHYSVYKHFYRY